MEYKDCIRIWKEGGDYSDVVDLIDELEAVGLEENKHVKYVTVPIPDVHIDILKSKYSKQVKEIIKKHSFIETE